MQKRIILGVMTFFIAVCVLLACVFVGYSIGADKPIQEIIVDDTIDVNTIAIVNLDEGVQKEDRLVNYANELIDLSSEYLVSTSLEEARIGIEEGRYAAYIIIPATFSENINSINETPVESQIQYALCNQLSSQSGLLAMSNIYLLINNLNNNVSYMYVDSILDEFHTAQNSVDEIMKNDKAANSIVNNVKPEDLSANIDLPSEEKLEYSPESLDYSAYLQNNWTLLSEINKAYSDGYSESKTEKEALETSAKTLSESISNINAKLKNVNVEKDAEGNYVYDAELTSLTTSLNNYNAQLSENMKEIINAANSGDGTIELLKENLATVLQCYSDTIDYYNKNLSSQLSTLTTTLSTGQYHLKLSKEMLRQALDEDDEVISGTVAVVFSDASQSNYALVNDEGVIDVSQLHMLISDLVQKNEVIYTIESADSKIGINKASVVVDNISSFQKDITYQKIENQEDGTQEYVKQDSNITAQINAIKTELDNLEKTLETFQNEQVVEIDTEAIVEDVKENVIDKLSLNAQSVSSIISAEYENQNNTLSTFENSLSAYDPFSHINQETIQTKKNMLTDNTNTLQTAMSTKDANDVMMMNKIYKQYNDNLTLLRNSITDAVDSSNQSVANGLEDVKNILNTNSGRNQELLQSFSEKLLYTRNGNLGNYRIYQYIVNPCESMNITKQNIEEKSEQIIVENDTGMDAQKMICLVGIITVIALLIAILIGALLKKQNNNNYNL